MDGMQLHLDIVMIFLLLFVDDIQVVMFPSTIKPLQNVIDQRELYGSNCILQVQIVKNESVSFQNGEKVL